MTFTLHERLAADCRLIDRSDKLIRLLLNDSRWPWIILVPITGATELHGLPGELRETLLDAAGDIGRHLRASGSDKVNVAAIGNLVPQLHYHVIGRRKDDPAWPGTVWGVPGAEPWSEDAAAAFIAALQAACPLS